MGTKQLIINADDFGLTDGVNEAIIEGHQRGVISSATLLINGEAAGSAAALAAGHPALGVGLHLNLTAGGPALSPDRVPSLVGKDGRFPGLTSAVARLSSGRARAAELEAEITAQIESCIKAGVVPTHLDSHHHLHALPRLRRILLRVCPELGIKKIRGYRMRIRSPKGLAVRVAAGIPVIGVPLKTPDRFCGIEVMGAGDFTAALGRELTAGDNTLEFMCHPGYNDERLAAVSSYSEPRQRELGALLDPAFREVINSSGARLISYREL